MRLCSLEQAVRYGAGRHGTAVPAVRTPVPRAAPRSLASAARGITEAVPARQDGLILASIIAMLSAAPTHTFAPPPAGCRVRIQYIDADYRRTERVIEPIRTYRSRNAETYLEAFCHLRREKRTFRLDRIASWVVEEVQERVSARPQASPTPLPPAPQLPPAPTPQPRAPQPTVVPSHARRGGGTWSWIAAVIVSGVIARILFPSQDRPTPAPRPYIPCPLPARTAAVTPATPGPAAAVAKVPSPPAPARTVRRLTYRGVAVTATPVGEEAWRYTAEELGLETRTRRGMHLAINARLFRRATGIADEGLEQRYAAADTDRDGGLSWAELEAFQYQLHREFRYLSNPTALRPDQFLAQGGGDCEDWALMTCGLLRYWGWTCYVGSFEPPGGREGHAVCLVRGEHRPVRYGYYTVTQALTWNGEAVPPGDYVPVDYEVVGGLSNAVGENWRLESFFRPEKIYGLTF
jgi:hypothetical protein